MVEVPNNDNVQERFDRLANMLGVPEVNNPYDAYSYYLRRDLRMLAEKLEDSSIEELKKVMERIGRKATQIIKNLSYIAYKGGDPKKVIKVLKKYGSSSDVEAPAPVNSWERISIQEVLLDFFTGITPYRGLSTSQQIENALNVLKHPEIVRSLTKENEWLGQSYQVLLSLLDFAGISGDPNDAKAWIEAYKNLAMIYTGREKTAEEIFRRNTKKAYELFGERFKDVAKYLAEKRDIDALLDIDDIPYNPGIIDKISRKIQENRTSNPKRLINYAKVLYVTDSLGIRQI